MKGALRTSPSEAQNTILQLYPIDHYIMIIFANRSVLVNISCFRSIYFCRQSGSTVLKSSFYVSTSKKILGRAKSTRAIVWNYSSVDP